MLRVSLSSALRGLPTCHGRDCRKSWTECLAVVRQGILWFFRWSSGTSDDSVQCLSATTEAGRTSYRDHSRLDTASCPESSCYYGVEVSGCNFHAEYLLRTKLNVFLHSIRHVGVPGITGVVNVK